MEDPQIEAAEITARLARVDLFRHTIEAAKRTWQIDAVRDQNRLLDASDHFEAFPYGLLLWDSSMILADTLGEMGTLEGRSVLELGAGVGLVGLVARHLGAEVMQTDYASEALALALRNAQLNAIEGITRRLADWTQWSMPGRFDFIVGSDILYDATAHAPIAAVLNANLAEDGIAVFTDPGRTATPLFVQNMREAGWQIEQTVRPIDAIQQVLNFETVEITTLKLQRG